MIFAGVLRQLAKPVTASVPTLFRMVRVFVPQLEPSPAVIATVGAFTFAALDPETPSP
ncbi:MAG: hypothetical protein JOY78_17650 [Pseudonocardia sp.]|nr:hypothetical protein [Pseudonocardia sp.]